MFGACPAVPVYLMRAMVAGEIMSRVGGKLKPEVYGHNQQVTVTSNLLVYLGSLSIKKYESMESVQTLLDPPQLPLESMDTKIAIPN